MIGIYILLFFLGAVFGSFINMAVYRVKHELDFMGRSFCDHTKEELGVLDLIPIFSYLFTQGKCRKCGEKLSLLYPIIEIITGTLFVATFLSLQTRYTDELTLMINWLVAIIFILFFVFFAVYDYYYWEVNVRTAEIAIIFGVIVSIIAIFIPDLIISGWSNLIAGLIGGGLIFLIVKLTKGGGMGAGDIYLFAFLGLFVGLAGLFPAFLITTVSGSIIGVIKAIKIGKMSGVKIQFAPFISFGAIMTFFFSQFFINLFHTDTLFFLLLNNF